VPISRANIWLQLDSFRYCSCQLIKQVKFSFSRLGLLRRYIKHSRHSLTTFLNTSKFIKNTLLHVHVTCIVNFSSWCLEMWPKTAFCVWYTYTCHVSLKNVKGTCIRTPAKLHHGSCQMDSNVVHICSNLFLGHLPLVLSCH